MGEVCECECECESESECVVQLRVMRSVSVAEQPSGVSLEVV